MLPVRPPVLSAEAEDIVRELYGIHGQAEELVAEFDRNFLVEAEDGRRFVLKISPKDTDEEAVDCQIQVLRFLATSDLADLFPKVEPALNGSTLMSHRVGDGSRHWVRLLTYLQGLRLAQLPKQPDALLRELGLTLGRVDHLLLSFDHPGAHREIPWDLTRTLELGRFLELIADGARRDLVRGMLDRFERRVMPRVDELPHSVIYNDANDHNILISDLDPQKARLCGLIDFGDMVHTATVSELAIACAYMMLRKPRPFDAAGHVVAGYDTQRSLTTLERSLLYDLVLARLCSSVLMSANAMVREPDNEYRMISSELVWRLLEELSTIEAEDARKALCPGP